MNDTTTIEPTNGTIAHTILDKEARMKALRQEEATLLAEIETEKRQVRASVLSQVKGLIAQLGDPKDVLAELGVTLVKPLHTAAPAPRHAPVVAMNPRSMNRRHSKGFRLNEGQYLAIQKALSAKDHTIKGVARRFGVSRQTVYGVRDGGQRSFPKAA